MPTLCSDCTINIGLFKKKFTCGKCQAIYCGNCFTKTAKIKVHCGPSQKQCLKCNIFSLPVYRREDLLLLNTKDLRCFLKSKNISTENCTEKFHLVDLVMNFAEATGQMSVTDLRKRDDQQAHVENLRLEARRLQEEDSRPTREDNNLFRGDINETNLPGIPSETQEKAPDLARKWKSIEDIVSLNEIDHLSVRDLKKILTVNFVDYKGCFEKKELIAKVKQLWTSQNSEKAGKKNTDRGDKEKGEQYEEDLCKICMDSRIDCVLLDCGHLVTCVKCGRRLAECPICRQLVVRVVHVFRA